MMTTKMSHQTFSFVILFLNIIFLNISSDVCAIMQKPFEFNEIKHLAGHRKGDKVEGLNQIKNYLKKFGYIPMNSNNDNENNNYFDGVLESAVKIYQSRHHLNQTGILDTETLSQMAMPRCAVPDYHSSESKFSFWGANLTWPDNHTDLKYAFITSPIPNNVSSLLELAFVAWAQSSTFTFAKTEDPTKADIHISYKHLDDNMFGCAYAPPTGRVYFDDEKPWAAELDGKIPSDTYSLLTVALHEVGHLLGLDHSTVREAVMWPNFDLGQSRSALNDDDIKGIQTLYPYRGRQRGSPGRGPRRPPLRRPPPRRTL